MPEPGLPRRVRRALLEPALLEGIRDGLAVRDRATGRLVLWNRAAEALTGWSLEVADRGLPDTPAAELVQLGRSWVELRALALDDARYVAYAFTDASSRVALREAYAELDQASTTDPLTGLPNRVLAEDRIRMSAELARADGRVMALFGVDLDRFRLVNDTLGSCVGDGLLREAARRLRGLVASHDTVARVGGDEFLVVIHDAPGPDGVEQLAASILEALRATFDVEGHEIHLTASMGIAVRPDHGDDAATLLRHVDLALERARSAGGACFSFATATIGDQWRERLRLIADLHGAIDRGELELYWQPQFNIDTGDVSGLEALVRWRHPERGLLGPGQFLSWCEEDGSIGGIDRWVVREAVAQARRWSDAGLEYGTVAVNLSAHSLSSTRVDEMVTEALAAVELPAHRLEVEVSEQVVAQHSGPAAIRLARLRELGVQVAIDDFGTGYSSLGHLKRLPLDTIKLDRSFVTDITGEPSMADVAILRAIVTLAADLGLRCVAEGVETTAQQRLLRFLQCHVVQGHLHAPALPTAAATTLLQERSRMVAPFRD